MKRKGEILSGIEGERRLPFPLLPERSQKNKGGGRRRSYPEGEKKEKKGGVRRQSILFLRRGRGIA